MPVEVERMMAAIAADGAPKAPRSVSASKEIYTSSVVESRPRSEGFASSKVVDVSADDVSVTDLTEISDGVEDSAVSGEESGSKKKRKSTKKDKKR
jgi:hypothetical protein